MKWSFTSKKKRQGKPLHTNQLLKLRQSGRFYGVQLYRSNCKACSQLAGKVFSFKDAPKLPVKGCDAPICNCEYLGVLDPRQNGERRSGRDRRKNIRLSMDRRSLQDRRIKTDQWNGLDQ